MLFRSGGQSRVVAVPPIADGARPGATRTVRVSFPSATGRTLRVTIDAVRAVRSTRFATSATVVEPVGLAEIGVPGIAPQAPPANVDSGCRSDLVAVDGRAVPVRITGARATADAPSGLAVTPCDPTDPARRPVLSLGPGTHRLVTASGDDVGWSIDRLALASGTAAAPLRSEEPHV